MRPTSLARMQSRAKENRELWLKELIAKNIADQRAALTTSSDAVTYRLIARSPESAAARALAFFVDDARELGITIEALFSHSGSTTALPDATHLPLEMCRYLADRRLLDAHEQLVLGTETTWVGDCLRRDPGSRNTYEFTRENCASTAHQAILCHLQLARGSHAATGGSAPLSHPTAIAQELVDASLIAATLASQTNALSRH